MLMAFSLTVSLGPDLGSRFGKCVKNLIYDIIDKSIINILPKKIPGRTKQNPIPGLPDSHFFLIRNF